MWLGRESVRMWLGRGNEVARTPPLTEWSKLIFFYVCYFSVGTSKLLPQQHRADREARGGGHQQNSIISPRQPD